MWMSGHVDEAEEAFSRAAMLALEKYPRYRAGLLDPKAWLTRLTYNVCMDLHRERKREKAVELHESVGYGAPPPGWQEDFGSPERRYLRREMEEFVIASIAELPDKLRVVAEAVFFENAPYAEIADRLAISQMALRKRVQQARALLRPKVTAYARGNAPAPSAEEVAEARATARPAAPRRPPLSPWSAGLPRAFEPVTAELPGGVRKDFQLWLMEKPKRPTARRLASLGRYVEEHPTGWKKRLERARLLRRLGRFGEAACEYARVVERQPRRPMPWVELAELLEALGRRGEAVELLDKARGRTAREATYHHLDALVRAQERRTGAGLLAFGRARGLEPDNAAHPAAAARLCLGSAWYVEAVEAAEAAVELAPDNPAVLTLAHDACLAAGRLLEAGRYLGRARDGDEPHPLTLSRRIDLAARLGRVGGEDGEEVDALVAQLRKTRPEAAGTWSSIARVDLARGEWDKAQGRLSGFLDAHPSHSGGWRRYGELLESLGKSAEAARALERAFELDPEDLEIRCALAELLPRVGSEGRALELLGESLDLYPEHAGLVRRTAEELTYLRNRETRVRELTARAVELQPRCPMTALFEGRMLARWGDVEAGAAAFERGWALLPPEDSFPHATELALALGEARERLGDEGRARGWYRAALGHADSFLTADPAAAGVARGRALIALGRWDEARTALGAALRRHLTFPERARVASVLERIRRVG